MKTGIPGPEGSLGKWQWAKYNQALTELGNEVARPRGHHGRTPTGATASCAPGPTRSRAAPPRCSRTSSPSACSACRSSGDAAMNFDLNDEQQEIKSTAKEFLANRFKPEKVRELAEARSYDDAPRGRRSPSSAGRASRSPRRTVARGSGWSSSPSLLEQSGFACAPSPLLGSAGAALVISAAGSDEQRSEWLPKLASRRGHRRLRRDRPLLEWRARAPSSATCPPPTSS